VLLTTRGQAVKFRTRAISALHALAASAPDGLRERLRTLPRGQLLQTCAGLRDSSRRSVEDSATVLAVRSTARRALASEQEAGELEAQLDRLVRRLAPELLDQLGIGSVVGPVSSSPPGPITDESVPRLPSPSSALPRPSRPRQGRSPAIDKTDREIDNSTARSTPSCWSECARTRPQRITCSVASPRARPSATSSDA
jgi:transposase